jgi:hypothetical protein
MCLVNLVDVVSQLSSAPVFQSMHGTAIFSDDVGISLNHAWDLFGLVRMDHEHNFVVSHSRTPYGLKPPVTRCGKEEGPVSGPAKFLRGGVYKGGRRFAMVKFDVSRRGKGLARTSLAYRLK